MSNRSKCNASTAAQIPEICRTVAPLKKYRTRAAMEVAFWCTAKSLRFCTLHTPHAVAVMLIVLAFHTKDPDGVGYTLNIFLLPNLSTLSGLEADLLTRNWNVIFGGETLNPFADTSLLMGKNRVAPIAGWDKAES